MIARHQPMRRGRGPGAASRKRRQQGGALALGRDSGTRESLTTERAFVMQRAAGNCELCTVAGRRAAPTDFAHCPPKSQPGSRDDRYHALGTCNPCNLAMQGAYTRGTPPYGRWHVTPIIRRDGVRGFDAELISAADKFSYRKGEYVMLAAGFVRAEIPA